MNALAKRYGWTETIAQPDDKTGGTIEEPNPCPIDEYFIKVLEAFIRDNAIAGIMQSEGDKAAAKAKEDRMADYNQIKVSDTRGLSPE
jgi:hypothetical protein